MVHTMRHWMLGVLPGLLLLAYSILHLFKKAAWLGPLASPTGTVLSWILFIAGLFVIIDSFFEFVFHSGMGITTLLFGLVFVALGLINVLNQFGVVAFQVPLIEIIYHVLLLIEGGLLVIAGGVMN